MFCVFWILICYQMHSVQILSLILLITSSFDWLSFLLSISFLRWTKGNFHPLVHSPKAATAGLRLTKDKSQKLLGVPHEWYGPNTEACSAAFLNAVRELNQKWSSLDLNWYTYLHKRWLTATQCLFFFNVL